MSTMPFRADYAPADERLIEQMLARNPIEGAKKDAIDERATAYVKAIRAQPKGASLEDFMQEYELTTKEGLALMVLSEALLRIPDGETQDRLIEDKLGRGEWDAPDGDEGWMLMAASWGIGLSAKIVRPDETPGNVLRGLVKRVGSPAVRTGVRQAMNFMGHQFVLGETIESALKRAQKMIRQGYYYSFDMLGEAARTEEDAQRYYDSYMNAIEKIGTEANEAPDGNFMSRPGISIKLSALSPRYFARCREEAIDVLVPRFRELCERAKELGMGVTMDAEEAERLELSLDIFARVAASDSLKDWTGLGLAVQAYQKRAPEVINWVEGLAIDLDRKFTCRLVKGAYWDTEIKRSQERGSEGFPVFTRKAATDLCYLDCARLLLKARPRIYPQFATHNALTLATIIEEGGKEGYEFQRLHGMGEALYAAEKRRAGVPVRIYAPVGGYKDLLAYLVRRLLENAANSSFVAKIADDEIPIEKLLVHPQEELRPLLEQGKPMTHPYITFPLDMYGEQRRNSRGVEFGHEPERIAVEAAQRRFEGPGTAISSIIGGKDYAGDGERHRITCPARSADSLGEWVEATPADVDVAMGAAHQAYPKWNAMGVAKRAEIINRFGDLIEVHRDRLLGVLCNEAGKTADDGIAEVREAVDFCRYYAARAQEDMAPRQMPGPVGETNVYSLEGRGVWSVISPWNFPLAIFVGQTVAALVTGNTVVTKPAPQTPLTAYMAIDLLREAGIPDGVCNLVLGAGAVGGAMTSDPRTAGVVFTGSTKTAKAIHRGLAERDGPIIPLIAETGGINCMIVDSTALPEQVTDDVITSAFRSAGQRCSALRQLYVQDSVADTMIEMIVGAAKALKIGDPRDLSVDVGPVIDADAQGRLQKHWDEVSSQGQVLYEGQTPEDGTFFAPRMVQMPAFDTLKEEAFGPILHIVRYKAKELPAAIEAIHKTGYGLTFGLHSRLEGRALEIGELIEAGNVYINRNMTGAIVGTQPFGGRKLSGTGPKAGGPNYLPRFCEEKVITENTAAAGGNASLIAQSGTD